VVKSHGSIDEVHKWSIAKKIKRGAAEAN